MKLLTLTREYPPNVYGGAGVVAEQLTRALSHRMAIEVRCFSEGGTESVRVARRRSDRGDMRCLGELCRISVRNVASRNNLCYAKAGQEVTRSKGLPKGDRLSADGFEEAHGRSQ